MRPDAVVSPKGDDHLLRHTPAAYFDRILANLAEARPTATALLGRVQRFLDGMREEDHDSLLSGLAGPQRLTIPGGGGVPILAPVVRDEEEESGKQYAEVRAVIQSSRDRIGAEAHFKPRAAGQSPTIAELGFWALWDWTILELLDRGAFGPLADAVNTFDIQLAMYHQHGLPAARTVGVVPWNAVLQYEREGAESD
jgi:hypothetical protein